MGLIVSFTVKEKAVAITIFHGDIIEGTFINRPNRFVVQCQIGEDLVSAYLPNPGRLIELLLPDVKVLLLKRNQAGLRYKAVAVIKCGRPVLLDTHTNNLVARNLIERGLINEFSTYDSLRSEARVGGSRFDFLLTKGKEQHYIEVKSCTLFGKKVAMFPDAPTERGRRHLLELSQLSQKGNKCHVLILVHSPEVRYFLPDYHTDISFAREFLSACDKVQIRAFGLSWTENLELSETVQRLMIPVELLAKEAHDRGCYMVVIEMKDSKVLTIGSLGKERFYKGYYVYVGSAMKNLTSRIERHKRRTKNRFWHIDYLLDDAQYIQAFALRTGDRIECLIAQRLRDICDWYIKGFGSSDCQCPSHLFGFYNYPMIDKRFIDNLLWLRMDRLFA
jgi:sugar fermentation stimulation protein A